MDGDDDGVAAADSAEVAAEGFNSLPLPALARALAGGDSSGGTEDDFAAARGLLDIATRLVALAERHRQLTLVFESLGSQLDESSLEFEQARDLLEANRGLLAELRAIVSPADAEAMIRGRIIDIRPDLEAVLVGYGLSHGARVGLRLVAVNSQRTELVVVATRQFISAAMVEKGALGDLEPGMLVEY